MVSALENPSLRAAAVPISVDQYHRLGKAGIIGRNTELLFGVIVEKVAKSPLHTWIVERLAALLRTLCDEDCIVRQEQPLTLDDSEPEPDIALVRGNLDQFKHAHPATAEMVIEIAITSAGLDLEKAAAYASADIKEYWLIEPSAGKITIFKEPHGKDYQGKSVYSRSEAAASHRLPEFQLTLSEFLA